MSTERIIKWLQSSTGQEALAIVKRDYPNLSSTRIGHVSFALGMYAKQISQDSLDKANVDELVRAVYGETEAEARGRKGGQAITPAKSDAARENGRKGGRPRKTEA